MKKTALFRSSIVLCSALAAITLSIPNLTYAVDREEFTKEYGQEYEKLLRDDPELAKAFKEEVSKAVETKEVSLERRDTPEAGGEGKKEFKEPGEGRMQDRGGDFDLSKPEDKTKALERLDKDAEHLKAAGLKEEDIKGIKEAISRGDNQAADKIFERAGVDAGPGREGPEGRMVRDFERGGPPEKGGREFNKEDMADHFREEMGREPTENEKQMMDKEFERPENERMRPEFDHERPDFERGRPEFDRDRPGMEHDRPEFEREKGEFDRERPEFDRERADRERPEFDRKRPDRERPEYEQREGPQPPKEPEGPPPPPPPEH